MDTLQESEDTNSKKRDYTDQRPKPLRTKDTYAGVPAARTCISRTLGSLSNLGIEKLRNLEVSGLSHWAESFPHCLCDWNRLLNP